MYTPATSKAASIQDDNSGRAKATNTPKLPSKLPSVVVAPKYKGPDTALAIFRHEFTTLPNEPILDSFSLKSNPRDWHNIMTDNKWDWEETICTCINAISKEQNGAAKLVLVVLWSRLLFDHQSCPLSDLSKFWSIAGAHAVETLFNFLGAPEQYLGWIQNVKQRNKGYLQGVVSNEGQKFFRLTRSGNIHRISDSTGIELAKHVIGELPTLKLEMI